MVTSIFSFFPTVFSTLSTKKLLFELHYDFGCIQKFCCWVRFQQFNTSQLYKLSSEHKCHGSSWKIKVYIGFQIYSLNGFMS